jgi:hypothetical protein
MAGRGVILRRGYTESGPLSDGNYAVRPAILLLERRVRLRGCCGLLHSRCGDFLEQGAQQFLFVARCGGTSSPRLRGSRPGCPVGSGPFRSRRCGGRYWYRPRRIWLGTLCPGRGDARQPLCLAAAGQHRGTEGPTAGAGHHRGTIRCATKAKPMHASSKRLALR